MSLKVLNRIRVRPSRRALRNSTGTQLSPSSRLLAALAEVKYYSIFRTSRDLESRGYRSGSMTETHRLRHGRIGGSARWAVIAASAFALLWTFALPAKEAQSASTQTPWQKLTPSQLTAVWWQWAFGIPVARSPFLDPTGANAASNQPYYPGRDNSGGLFFLAGTFAVTQLANGDVLGEVTRSISLQAGTTVFFPLLNAEWDNICNKPRLGGNCFSAATFPAVLSVPEEQRLVAGVEDSATGLYATLTPATGGPTQNLVYSRLQSQPFSYKVPPTDNLYQTLYGFNVTGTIAPAVSDGYWSFLPATLPAGTYILQFGGRTPLSDTANFIEAITYLITITP
jgi:hypothetical protein